MGGWGGGVGSSSTGKRVRTLYPDTERQVVSDNNPCTWSSTYLNDAYTYAPTHSHTYVGKKF